MDDNMLLVTGIGFLILSALLVYLGVRLFMLLFKKCEQNRKHQVIFFAVLLFIFACCGCVLFWDPVAPFAVLGMLCLLFSEPKVLEFITMPMWGKILPASLIIIFSLCCIITAVILLIRKKFICGSILLGYTAALVCFAYSISLVKIMDDNMLLVTGIGFLSALLVYLGVRLFMLLFKKCEQNRKHQVIFFAVLLFIFACCGCVLFWDPVAPFAVLGMLCLLFSEPKVLEFITMPMWGKILPASLIIIFSLCCIITAVILLIRKKFICGSILLGYTAALVCFAYSISPVKIGTKCIVCEKFHAHYYIEKQKHKHFERCCSEKCQYLLKFGEKCVGCGKWIKNMGIVAYFNSEWEARGYCSAECREKNPNAEAEKMVLCGHCKNPEDRHYTVNIRCGNCGKVFGKSKECPGFHYSYARRCFDCDRADEERWPRTGPVAEVKGKNDE